MLQFGGVRAVLLGGSRAHHFDNPEADDWDLEVYTDEDPYPDPEMRRRAWAALPPFDAPRATAVGAMNDRFVVGGLYFGWTYYPVGRTESEISSVVAGEWKEHPFFAPEALASEIAGAQPLWDPEGLVASWRARA